MALWDWLIKKRSLQLSPERLWRVTIDQEVLEVFPPEGESQRLLMADLSGVAVETNDTGPWGADVWWLLFGREGQLICSFPQGATGEQSVIDRLVTLPNFDHEVMMRAMSSTANEVFPLWRMDKY